MVTHRDEHGALILHGDCLAVMKELPDNSVDSVVTDPPYGISFMGREWDDPGKMLGQISEGHEQRGAYAYGGTHSRGYADNDNAKFQAWFTLVAKECLRVLKPGGHMLSFGGSRTWHRLASAVEDAGFEIRDSIAWLYGSGFPKSHNVGFAIDREAGAKREVVETKPQKGAKFKTWDNARSVHGFGSPERDGFAVTAPATPEAQAWAGWGTALKPAFEPVVVARKPLVGTVAQNVLTHGTGALNIDACRVGSEQRTYDLTMTSGNFETTSGGLNRKQGEKTVEGRFPANVVLTHAEGCVATGETISEQATEASLNPWVEAAGTNFAMKSGGTPGQATPIYACAPGCPVAEIDKQSGYSKSTPQKGHVQNKSWAGDERSAKAAGIYGPGRVCPPSNHNDEGGASRYFQQTEWEEWKAPFLYQAKAPTKERPVHPVTGKGHPTVKPIALMRYLIRLVTPPGGTVLDPFAGSGTTVEAALLEGKRVIGIELTDEYLPLIDARINRWAAAQPSLFDAA